MQPTAVVGILMRWKEVTRYLLILPGLRESLGKGSVKESMPCLVSQTWLLLSSTDGLDCKKAIYPFLC